MPRHCITCQIVCKVPTCKLPTCEPGDLQLAPVITDTTSQAQVINQSQQQESESEMSKIDIQRPTVLDSFREPLNTILKS
ncbi:hypothetical protein TNCV_746971 [Trichonephila clavipes]|nr:hypothetical protein TNCV_701461 [Trichonephila clavipes]GFX38916.1 hypothetical protein TNCV_746971 [Trichonephila clavipes]